jgi:hypothetical protein
MAEIVNLNHARKAAARREESAKAAENRAKHGRSRAEREAEAKRRAVYDRALDGARQE